MNMYEDGHVLDNDIALKYINTVKIITRIMKEFNTVCDDIYLDLKMQCLKRLTSLAPFDTV